MAEVKNKITKKKKQKKNIKEGKVYIKATFTDLEGNVIASNSSGRSGFKGSRKATPYASQMAAQAAAEDAKHHGIERVEAYIKGIGSGRESALRAVQSSDIYVVAINDITPVPHNGCRPPKPRRI